MSEKTAGQIAYETFQATRWPDSPCTGWNHPANKKARPAWEAAAQAAIGAVLAPHPLDCRCDDCYATLQAESLAAADLDPDWPRTW